MLSPLGLETDSVRTWEALVLDCIPIVEHTFLDPSYDRLPVVMVHDWAEVTPAFLEKKYEELKDRKSDEIYFDYWHDMLKDFQKTIRNNELFFSQLEANQFNQQDLEDLASILPKNGGIDQALIYKGFFSSIRPLKIANTFPFLSKICLCDPWMDQEMFQGLDKYLVDHSYLRNRSKVVVLCSDNEMFNSVSMNPGAPVFLDLTYYRTSLLIDFRANIIGYGNFRQSLKPDLQKIYNQLGKGTLLCGNRVHNEYVSEVLERFSEENNLKIERKGSFWYLVKK